MTDIGGTDARLIHDAWGCEACTGVTTCWLIVALDEVDRLRAKLNAVRSIHKAFAYRDADGTWYECQYDRDHWPCRTIEACDD
jgi:hypothetical protein